MKKELHFFVPGKKKYCVVMEMFIPPNYQQGSSDCGYWSLRVAAEITLERKFSRDEIARFGQFKGMCAKSGSCLALSSARFEALFPDTGVHFNEASAYCDTDDEYVSPESIRACLDQGRVVVLNVQHVKFRGASLIPGGPKEDGHNVCCVGYGEEKGEEVFVLQDTNRYRGSCRETLAVSTVRSGYDRLVAAGVDLETRRKAMLRETYVSEMYVADTEVRDPPLRKYRLRSANKARER